MSWSVHAIGKPSAVASAIAMQMQNIIRQNMEEPEEGARRRAAETIAETLAIMPPHLCIKIQASGTQHAPNGATYPERTHTHSLSIELVCGYVE